MEAIDFYTNLTSSNSEVTVHWVPETFRGQIIDMIRIHTDPNDDTCDPYCEIAVASTSHSGEHTITDLIPGQGKLQLL